MEECAEHGALHIFRLLEQDRHCGKMQQPALLGGEPGAARRWSNRSTDAEAAFLKRNLSSTANLGITLTSRCGALLIQVKSHSYTTERGQVKQNLICVFVKQNCQTLIKCGAERSLALLKGIRYESEDRYGKRHRTLETMKQTLKKRLISRTSGRLLHTITWQHPSIVLLFLLLSMGLGLGVSTAHAQILAYVTNTSFGTVSVIDTATNTVVASIPVGTAPFGVAITPNGARVYVANRDSGTISVIDTATNAVFATIPLVASPYGIAVTPDGSRAYVTVGFITVSVLDVTTNTVITSIPIIPAPENSPSSIGIAITPDGSRST